MQLSSVAVFWTWEVRPDIVFADPVMSAYFGLEAKEGERGQPLERFMEAIHSEDRDRVRLAIARAVATGEPYSETYRVHTAFGQQRVLTAEGRCFRDLKGRPHLYPGRIVDITGQAVLAGSLSELHRCLERSLAMAHAARLPFLQHLIAMAVLECSGDKETASQKNKNLN